MLKPGGNRGGEENEDVQVLREELDRLRQIVEQQADKIAAVGGKIVKQESGTGLLMAEKSPNQTQGHPLA